MARRAKHRPRSVARPVSRAVVRLRARCGRSAAEVRPRCGRGAAEVQTRCGRGAARGLAERASRLRVGGEPRAKRLVVCHHGHVLCELGRALAEQPALAVVDMHVARCHGDDGQAAAQRLDEGSAVPGQAPAG